MESTEWEGVMALLQFYQMECRWSIRQLLLRALSAMCALHTTPRAIMLTSVLPMELARYVRGKKHGAHPIANVYYLQGYAEQP
jgi:hypothetical protein